MISRRIFLTSLSSAAAFVKSWRPAWAQPAAATKITFVLFNDFYIMGEQLLPDGKTRGGFARLATVVKDERAKGRNVIFAHGGDTLSPSVMSGFDRGKHIIALINMIAPDIFVAGNHEFDFGTDVLFSSAWREAKFPLYGANLRLADGKPAARAQGPRDSELRRRANRAYRSRLRKLVAAFLAGRFEIPADGRDREGAGSPAAQRRRGLRRRRAALRSRRRATAAILARPGPAADRPYARSLSSITTARSASSSPATTRSTSPASMSISWCANENGKRAATWWPKFRVIDTADVTPDPEVAAAVARFEADFTREAEVPIAKTEVELDSRNATIRTREAAIGNLFADAMRLSMKADAAVINGGGIRSGKVYAPGSAITRKDILAELPFNNRVVVVEITGAALRRAMENGLRAGAGCSGAISASIGHHSFRSIRRRRCGSRVLSMEVAGKPLEPEKVYRVAILDFLARGGDDYSMFRDAKRITPDTDAPLLANEVMNYIRRSAR